jgi:hypothetical protein
MEIRGKQTEFALVVELTDDMDPVSHNSLGLGHTEQGCINVNDGKVKLLFKSEEGFKDTGKVIRVSCQCFAVGTLALVGRSAA